MNNIIQNEFSGISNVLNMTTSEIKNLENEYERKETHKERKKEIERELIFWRRLHMHQVDGISELVHEAVRRKESIEVNSLEEIKSLVNFFIVRGVEGHKVITINPNMPKTTYLNEFLNAYCAENIRLMKNLI